MMNKRIKELADRAEDYAYSIVDQGGEFNLPGEFHSAYSEKFAELIVKECIKKVLEGTFSERDIDKEDDITDRCFLRGVNGGIVDASGRIQRHFGVK